MQTPEERIEYLTAQVAARELRLDDLNREITRLKGGRPLAIPDTDFKLGIKRLAEHLLNLAVDEKHHGDLDCSDIVRAASSFGVVVEGPLC